MPLPTNQPRRMDSSEAGAPTVNNTVGSLLEMLRCVFVTGFNPRSVTSIVVAAGVATATAATHGYTNGLGRLLLIEGAPEAGLNGLQQPITVTTNTFTYAAPGIADGTYSGTITAKRAPLGWVEAHTGTNGAIFARTAPEATSSMLKVLDSRASPAHVSYAQVTMVATATDFSTVTNEAPTTELTASMWGTGANDATVKPWEVLGDDLFAYLVLPSLSGGIGNLYCFGDPVLLYPGDAGGAMLVTHGSVPGAGAGSLGGLGGPAIINFSATGTQNRIFFHRTLANTVAFVPASVCGAVGWGDAGASGDVVIPVTSDYYFRTAAEIRAKLPGLYIPQGNNAFNAGEVYEFPGLNRKLLCVSFRRVAGGGAGQLFLDMSAPWR
ncbi:MAG: hypothetical protein ACK40L_04935 [Hydrogenophaga sp.]